MTTAQSTDERSRALDLLANGGLLIGDDVLVSSSGGVAEHINPATGQPQAEFVMAGSAEIDMAVSAARQAFQGWREVEPDRRRAVLLNIARLLRSEAENLNLIAALEIGQPLNTPMKASNALRTADYFEYYAGWVDKLEGRVIPVYPGRAMDYTRLEPYGVIGAIMSWNGPMGPIGRKLAPALAAGNTVVLKTSDLAPFSAIYFGDLCRRAGLPGGVVNVVAGGAEAGVSLVKHPHVGRVSFTGSVPTGRQIYIDSADKLEPPLLELGGKSANIIFPDADLDKAFRLAAERSVVMGAGQGCLLPTRLLVHESIMKAALESIKNVVAGVRVGDPFDPQSQMGPVISSGAADRIMSIIDRAVAEGDGELLVGGKRAPGELSKGYFIEPTVFAGVDNASTLAQTEIFGPVLAVIPFSSEEEAIEIANDSPFGLAAYLHTSDLTRAHVVAGALEAGYVSINGMNPMPPTAPFGGYRVSGAGYENGREGIMEFLRTKNVYIDLS
ncbi:MAG: aldA 4 [Frankiales bacterium]|nr:aldA 4 [Frankiales bacterium]